MLYTKRQITLNLQVLLNCIIFIALEHVLCHTNKEDEVNLP